MPNDPTVALDLPNDDASFLCGDVLGNVHLMRLDSPHPVTSFNALGLTIRSPLTTLTLCDKGTSLLAGNLHGYVKLWTIGKGNKFAESRRFRAHNEAVISVSVSH